MICSVPLPAVTARASETLPSMVSWRISGTFYDRFQESERWLPGWFKVVSLKHTTNVSRMNEPFCARGIERVQWKDSREGEWRSPR